MERIPPTHMTSSMVRVVSHWPVGVWSPGAILVWCCASPSAVCCRGLDSQRSSNGKETDTREPQQPTEVMRSSSEHILRWLVSPWRVVSTLSIHGSLDAVWQRSKGSNKPKQPCTSNHKNKNTNKIDNQTCIYILLYFASLLKCLAQSFHRNIFFSKSQSFQPQNQLWTKNTINSNHMRFQT